MKFYVDQHVAILPNNAQSISYNIYLKVYIYDRLFPWTIVWYDYIEWTCVIYDWCMESFAVNIPFMLSELPST